MTKRLLPRGKVTVNDILADDAVRAAVDGLSAMVPELEGVIIITRKRDGEVAYKSPGLTGDALLALLAIVQAAILRPDEESA